MKRLRFFAFAIVALAAIAGAHIYEVLNGVHFKGDAPVDFGQPPARESDTAPPGDGMDNGYGPWRPGTTYLLDVAAASDDGAAIEKRDKRLASKALSLERVGKFDAALDFYRGMDRRDEGDSSFVRERIAALEEGLRRKDRPALAAYLGGKPSGAEWLRPFYGYDALILQQSGPSRGRKFAALGTRSKGSPWEEPILMMAARDLLSDVTTSTAVMQPSRADIEAAVPILEKVLKNRGSRFYANALGWMARARYLQGDYGGAVSVYWRQLPLLADGNSRRMALNSIWTCETVLKHDGRAAYTDLLALDREKDAEMRVFYFRRVGRDLGGFTAADAKEFWIGLKTSPAALSAYLDYRLDRTAVTPDILGLTKTAKIDGPYAGHILGRLAEAAYRLRRLGATLDYCKRCLAVASNADDRGLATYLTASVAQHRGESAKAIAGYEKVLRDFRKSYVGQGARENLALLYEHAGRLDDALDMYYALGYDHDVAYMLDMRMATDQIEGYLRSHPNHASRDVIRYSLGMRYLREHRFADAEHAFLMVPEWKRKAYIGGTTWTEEDSFPMRDPLLTTHDLAVRYEAVKQAKTDESRAKALLSIGNYYYTRRNLLLYNARLWHFERTDSIAWSWNTSTATKEDDEALQRHHEEHECLAQAMRVFDELLRKYPNSSSAQRAAYRDACAVWRLSNFSPYWRWVADRGNLRLRAVNLMHSATKGADAHLAKTAQKFAGVFLEEADESRASFGDEYKNGVPPRRWNPSW
ncbi:MAG TPA: tetratricopeptide repeat protein [Fimbriimonadaceae bacterium]|nr:tetratricopeptide repeat protein [Fimbriimonadaceae bacterium]